MHCTLYFNFTADVIKTYCRGLEDNCKTKYALYMYIHEYTFCLHQESLWLYVCLSCSAIALPFAFFGPGTQSIAIDRLDCTGIEDMLTECDYATDSTFCFHIEDASVLCQCKH